MKLNTFLKYVVLAFSLLLPLKSFACDTESYIGGNFAMANGQLLPIANNQALFAILGTTYGGDGRTTFALPDLRGRAAIGVGQGLGLQDYRLGQRGGADIHTLNTAQMPSYNHSVPTPFASTADTSASVANSPRRENIYNYGLPNVNMNSSSINLNVDMNTTATTIGT